VKALGKGFDDVAVVESGEIRLLHQVARDVRRVLGGGVLLGDDVPGQHVSGHGCGIAPLRLKCRERALRVASHVAVEHAGREAGAIQHHLNPECVRKRGSWPLRLTTHECERHDQ
jgi:hypothetical protein